MAFATIAYQIARIGVALYSITAANREENLDDAMGGPLRSSV